MLPQHVVLLCLKLKKTATYRDLVDELIEMPRIRAALDLDSIPAPSTLCKAFDRLEMAVWRVLLNVSLDDLPLNGVTGIDASGFERTHGSTHYTKRTYLSIQQLKTTLLVDTAANAVPDIHVTTTRKHDTQIAPQVVTTLICWSVQAQRSRDHPVSSVVQPHRRLGRKQMGGGGFGGGESVSGLLWVGVCQETSRRQEWHFPAISSERSIQ